MNKKVIILVVAIIVIVGLFTLNFVKDSNNTEASVLTIGLSFPLTGDLAFLGEEAKRGVEIAIDEATQNGVNVIALFEDNEFKPRVITSVAHKFINQDKVDASIVFTLTESNPIRPIHNDGKTPLLVLWDSDEEIKNAGDYIFSNGFSVEDNAIKMAKYAFSEVGVRKMALIQDVDEAAYLYAKSFENEFKKLGGDVVIVEQVQVGSNDYRTSLTKIKQTEPDSVYFSILPPSNISFIKQLRELDIDVELFTNDSFVEDVVMELGSLGNDIYFHNFVSSNDDLAKKYLQKYGEESPGLNYAEAAYQSAKVVIEAYTINKNSVRGGLIEILGEDQTASQLQPIYQVQNGISVMVLE